MMPYKKIFNKLRYLCWHYFPIKHIMLLCLKRGYIKPALVKVKVFNYSIMKREVLRYVASQKDSSQIGQYNYSEASKVPNLYASCFACLTRDMLGDLDLSEQEKDEWAAYLNAFQSEQDGLFYDASLQGEMYLSEDWWGARHLAAIMVGVFFALERKPRYAFTFLSSLYSPDEMKCWLNQQDWQQGIAYTSNRLMNYGVLLQYQRDVFGDKQAGQALQVMMDFLDEKAKQNNVLWGDGALDINNPKYRSELVQAAYHFFLLYFFDESPMPFPVNKVIDVVLLTQNKWGGFGVDLNASACEDIDSIDILYRCMNLTDYRRADIIKAFRKALPWIFANQNTDGGFVFRRYEALKYGHANMFAQRNQSHLFATWFRSLSIVYLAVSLGLTNTFTLRRAPGYGFITRNRHESN